MFAKKDKKVKEKNYHEQAIDWESEIVIANRNSAKRAWIVAFFSVIVALTSVFAIAMLTPLKTVEPFVIRVDTATGIPDIISSLNQESRTTYEEVINKYFINKYITLRESFHANTLDADYYAVGLMSDINIQNAYASLYDVKKNPESPLIIYGQAKADCEVNIKSITFLSETVAQVRFSKRAKLPTGTQVSHWVATLSFTYYTGKMTENDRLISPLGFMVTEYRLDAEILTGE